MMLKQYMEERGINAWTMAFHVGCVPATIYNINNGMKPRQKLAEQIEKATSGHVTVLEIRGGFDTRIKKKSKRKPGRLKTGAVELEKAKKAKKDPYHPIILSEKRRDNYSEVLAKQRKIHEKKK